MSIIEKNISSLIESQFPEFYKEQGPLFILFVEEYYKWLESNDPDYATYSDTTFVGNPLYHSRRLQEYRNIDQTVDEFYVYFKEKFLKNVEITAQVSEDRLVKASNDLYKSKGSERSLDLFFKLLYGTKIEIYNPGEDILKPSDGTWVIPQYLELTVSSRTKNYVGKQVTGSISGATAFVEYIITRNINGKIIDYAFLSNKSGTFIANELLLDEPSVVNAPKILGSLTSLDTTLGGEGFAVGETVKIISSNGVEGIARVTSIESVTGLVQFTLVDGGWGYSNTTAETVISSDVLRITNVTNANTEITTFFRNEIVTQELYEFRLNNVTGNFTKNKEIYNGNIAAPSVSIIADVSQNTTTVIGSSNTANLIINLVENDIFSNNVLYLPDQQIIFATLDYFAIGDEVVQSNGTGNNVTGTVSAIVSSTAISPNTSTIGANGIHVGTYVIQPGTGATGYVTAIPSQNYFTYTNVNVFTVRGGSGTFNNLSSISNYTDSTQTTLIGTFDPNIILFGYEYTISDTSTTGTDKWSYANTIVKVGSQSVNAVIHLASDIGGIVQAYTNVSASANLFASNSTAIGITSVTGDFYGSGNTIIIGQTSNTRAKTTLLFTGFGADFNLGIISDAETVRLSPDLISSNNDGPGANSVKFTEMLISGANSTYNNLNSVYIMTGGSGYDNTNIVTFSGGNSGAGSFTAGNASIITDTSGVIVAVGLSANVGNKIVSTPSTSVVNSTGGSTGVGTGAELIPVSSLGFIKQPGGDITYTILDLLRFNTLTIGTISSLTNINPGENYNVNPFVSVYEPYVASYGRRDIVIEVADLTGPGFAVGEYVEQTISTPGVEIKSNTFSGNSSNVYEVQEQVYSTDGINNTATGFIYSASKDNTTGIYTTVLVSNTGTWQNSVNVSILTVLSNTNFEPGNEIFQSTTANGILVASNSTTLVVRSVEGTFTSGAITSNASPTPGSTTVTAEANTKIFKLIGATSNGASVITNTSPYIASATAKATVKINDSDKFLTLKRVSLFTEFVVSNTVVGKTTGSTANVVSVSADPSSNVIGDNAIVVANVVATQGTISGLEVTDSGTGYINNEGVNVSSLDGSRFASAKANVSTSGIGTGYYSSTRSFLDDTKYIQDGEYYQNFSYEIQTSIPVEKYFDTLKQVLHVAGKKMYGRVLLDIDGNFNIISNSNITIT